MTNLITKLEMGKYAERLSEALTRAKIENIEDLEKKTGVVPIKYVEGHDVVLSMHQSKEDSMRTISYNIEGVATPINAIFNLAQKYLVVTVRGNFTLPDYDVLGRDHAGNVTQGRMIAEPSIERLKEELRYLRWRA